jgi:uncharacterized membrane protein
VNWFKKLPNTIRAASGLEWVLWRKLPWIALVGTLAPLVCLGLLHWTVEPDSDPAQTRWLQMADYMVGGIVVLHWTLVLTVAVGCVIVMVMKGPGYVADSYKVSHSDQPRSQQETAQEAASSRLSSSKITDGD